MALQLAWPVSNVGQVIVDSVDGGLRIMEQTICFCRCSRQHEYDLLKFMRLEELLPADRDDFASLAAILVSWVIFSDLSGGI